LIRDRLLARLTQIPGTRTIWRRFPVGSVDTRVRYDIFDRPHYAFGVHSASYLAKRLGLDTITVVELGVAGGRGLLALKSVAATMGKHFGMQINVVGFDTGEGMPAPSDYRDLPHVWGEGFYRMDVAKLKGQLGPDTELILGDIEETLSSWSSKGKIGFIAFDLDYYSSTKQAFRIFQDSAKRPCLPRTYCYFDDLMWPEYACHNDYLGELCAIREFNEEHEHRKLCPVNMLKYTRTHQSPWNEQIYVMHDFKHPLYCKNLTTSDALNTQMPL
jgi:hypothetical protein